MNPRKQPIAFGVGNRSIPDTHSYNKSRYNKYRSKVMLTAIAALVCVGGCSTLGNNDDGDAKEIGATAKPSADPGATLPDFPVADFDELGFSLNAGEFDVRPESATRRTWADGYRLESATWRGATGFPRIMINVLDVSESGQSFTDASELARPVIDRINDLLPGELIDMRAKGQIDNHYGQSNYQTFTVDSRMACAFVNQFLTTKAETAESGTFGEIVVEAIICDERSTAIDRHYLTRFSNAYRIGQSGS